MVVKEMTTAHLHIVGRGKKATAFLFIVSGEQRKETEPRQTDRHRLVLIGSIYFLAAPNDRKRPPRILAGFWTRRDVCRRRRRWISDRMLALLVGQCGASPFFFLFAAFDLVAATTHQQIQKKSSFHEYTN